jgi:hypothetical protein
MERLLAPLTAAVAGLAVGCAGVRPGDLSLDKLKARVTAPSSPAAAAPAPTVVNKAAADPQPVKGVPATEFTFGWRNRLAQLPDPTKGGAMNPGLVGQVFLFTHDLKPADVAGELSVLVSDVSPRPPGQPKPKDEMWHFTADVLRTKVVNDERFGRSVVVFLPWPPEWRDVNTVSIQARYDQPNGQTLYAQPTTVTLDFSNSSGQAAVQPGQAGLPSIPDPKAVLQQVRANGGFAPPATATAMTAPPSATAIPMNLRPANGFPPMTAQPAGGFPPAMQPVGGFPPAMQQPPMQPAGGFPPAMQQQQMVQPAGGFPQPGMPPGDGTRIVIPRG